MNEFSFYYFSRQTSSFLLFKFWLCPMMVVTFDNSSTDELKKLVKGLPANSEHWKWSVMTGEGRPESIEQLNSWPWNSTCGGGECWKICKISDIMRISVDFRHCSFLKLYINRLNPKLVRWCDLIPERFMIYSDGEVESNRDEWNGTTKIDTGRRRRCSINFAFKIWSPSMAQISGEIQQLVQVIDIVSCWFFFLHTSPVRKRKCFLVVELIWHSWL